MNSPTTLGPSMRSIPSSSRTASVSATTPTGGAGRRPSSAASVTSSSTGRCNWGPAGAGAAVAHGALMRGVGQLTIFDVDPARAQELAASLCERFGAGRAVAGTDLAAAMAVTDGLIHCTPTGMAKLPGMPLPAELLRPGIWVSEIVYFPLETELLRVA